MWPLSDPNSVKISKIVSIEFTYFQAGLYYEPMNILDQFMTLCDTASHHCRIQPGTKDFEPSFLKVLQFINQHPDHDADFKKRFAASLGEVDGPIDWELVQFCMREKQWLEIKAAASEAILHAESSRTISEMEAIIDVYEEEWPDEELYEYYANKKFR